VGSRVALAAVHYEPFVLPNPRSKDGLTMKPADKARDAAAVSPDAFRSVMRHVTAPVAVIAAQIGARRAGLTATSVCSATADPPTLLICVNHSAAACDLILEAGAFSVNFLTDMQTEIARLFSTPRLSSDDRFAGGIWSPAVTGAPVLQGAVGAFDCRVVEASSCGTHQIILGRVVAAQALEGDPLLYRDGFFRRIAPA
jgi:flavin reductase